MTRTVRFTVGALREMRAGFQRPLSANRVSRIVNRWDPNLWEMPVVCFCDDGSYVLVEGQHRIHAAAEVLGDSYEVECRVAIGVDPATLFVALSEAKRPIQPIEKLTAMIEAEDPDALGLLRLAQFHGFEVKKSSAPTTLSAANIMLRAYRSDHVALNDAFEALAGIIKRRNNEHGWSRGSVVYAFWYFMRVTANYDVTKFVDSVSRVPPVIAVPYHTNEFRRNVIELMAIYNKGRRQKNHVEADWSRVKNEALCTRHSSPAYDRLTATRCQKLTLSNCSGRLAALVSYYWAGVMARGHDAGCAIPLRLPPRLSRGRSCVRGVPLTSLTQSGTS